MNETPPGLLDNDEPPPFTVDNAAGTSPFLIVADHAGKHLPRRLAQLGLSAAERRSHIAWDIGIGAVCALLGAALDAVVIRQNYSRLVIDCNRKPGSEQSIVDLSERTPVPGNAGLSESHKRDRVREIFRPYHDRITAELDRRRASGRPTALVSMHSFTPVFKGVARPWHAGVLYNRDPRLGAPAARGRARHRRQRALRRDRRNRLHDPGPRRGAAIAARGDRDSPGVDRGGSGAGNVGGLVGAVAAAGLSAAYAPRAPRMKTAARQPAP
jgi:predicted N-formylglutamate amidohydrolase